MSKEAFDELLTPHLEAIRRFVRRHMRAGDHVDDVVQRTLLRAFCHRHQLRDRARFKSWLCSIAVNEIRMLLRSTKPCVSLSLCAELEATDTAYSPFTRFQDWERQNHLKLAMAGLRDHDQVTIRWELDGWSVAQIAAATATSIAAAKSARFRARRRLALALRNRRFALSAVVR